jgi:hypothetical protein
MVYCWVEKTLNVVRVLNGVLIDRKILDVVRLLYGVMMGRKIA